MGQRNIIAGLLLLVLAIGYGAVAVQLPERNIAGTPGPAFFPGLIAGILFVLSAGLIFQGAKALRSRDGIAAPGGLDRRGMAMLGAFAAYIAVLPAAGFLIASIPFAAVLIRLYGGRSRLLMAAVSIGLPVFLLILFREGFGIILPAGTYALFGG